MTSPLSDLDLRSLAPDDTALLLDLDGTLAAIVDRPGDAVVTASARRTLSRLRSALSGAVAIVSGRPIADVDRMLAPDRLPVAGIHGIERRDARGGLHLSDVDYDRLDAVIRALEEQTAHANGLLVEKKPGAVTLHYRARPDLGPDCERIVSALVDAHPGIVLLRGKMVFELKMNDRTKAEAVRDFMTESPFRSRRPVYAGDDTTDEDAFQAVRALGGIAIKVGDGDTAAGYRVSGTAEFLGWLSLLSDHMTDRMET